MPKKKKVVKIIKKAPVVSPAILAVRKSAGTLDKVIELIESKKGYAQVIQQIDASIGLAQAAKRLLMNEYIHSTIKEAKNQKKLAEDLQKLYTFTTK